MRVNNRLVSGFPDSSVRVFPVLRDELTKFHEHSLRLVVSGASSANDFGRAANNFAVGVQLMLSTSHVADAYRSRRSISPKRRQFLFAGHRVSEEVVARHE